MTAEPPLHADLRATVAARRELGPGYEDELVDAFLERIDHRIDERLRADRPAATAATRKGPAFDNVLAIASLGVGVPLSAIAGGIGHTPGLLIAWTGIVAVNAASALGRRREGHPGSRR